MKSWPHLVAGLYLLLLLVLAIPAIVLFPKEEPRDVVKALPFVIGICAVLSAAQLTLLLVPVDVARERPVSRRKLLVPVIVTGLLSSLLMVAGLATLVLGFTGDKVDQYFSDPMVELGPLPFLWLVWGWVFYCYFKTRDPRALVARLMTGLLRGSILELLVAIPSHIVARRRDDCCAPALTFLGLVTGLALMLMSFGPGVLYLFARRLRELRRAQEAEPDRIL